MFAHFIDIWPIIYDIGGLGQLKPQMTALPAASFSGGIYTKIGRCPYYESFK
jgi:hypothetical protein